MSFINQCVYNFTHCNLCPRGTQKELCGEWKSNAFERSIDLAQVLQALEVPESRVATSSVCIFRSDLMTIHMKAEGPPRWLILKEIVRCHKDVINEVE